MSANLRRDVDFNGLFRKLGHPLEEIRVRALSNIQSKLEHKLICYADIVHEKQLYVRLLEWFNIPDCTHKTEVLSLLNQLAQHSPGAQLLQDIGGIEFLSQLRCDIEPCHRPIIDQILESTMHLPDQESHVHAPECIYHKLRDSAVWGASTLTTEDKSHMSESLGSRLTTNLDRLSQYVPGGPSYFTNGATQRVPPQHREENVGTEQSLFNTKDYNANIFRLSTFPWLPLTGIDQQVITSTNNSLQTKDSAMLIGACEFLADVVFQDFPAELFLQRPGILKNLLSLLSLPTASSQPVVTQSCQTLTIFIKCLQARIRYFQDSSMYISKHDFTSSNSTISSSSSSRGDGPLLPQGQQFSWCDRRHRGDGQDGDSSSSASGASSVVPDPDTDLDLEEGTRLQHQQLTLPQFCVALLQRILPQLKTDDEALGVRLLELLAEVVTVLSSVLDASFWADDESSAKDMVDRLTDCMEVMAELMESHHHHHTQSLPADARSLSREDLATHRVLFMGLVTVVTKFLTMIPLEKMDRVLPEKLKSCLYTIIYDEPLAVVYPRCRAVCLTIGQTLGLSVPLDYQHAVDICHSMANTCLFCLQVEDKQRPTSELARLACDGIRSLNYHLYFPFVSKFVKFISTICSSKKTDQGVITQCTGVLLQLMSYPVDSVREVCYATILDTIKSCLQVSYAVMPESKASFQAKFIMNPDILYELVSFGLSDTLEKVRTSSCETLHRLLQSQLLMSEGLWQEFILSLTKSLPVLQSYTDQSTSLGRGLWYMLDPTTTTHNLSLLDKLRGVLRLFFLADKKLRLEAAKHLKWFLCNEQNVENKLPSAFDLDPSSLSCDLVTLTTQLVEEDTSRSVFKEEGMVQVYDIFTSDPVDPGVKKSAGDQLAIMMKDPYLHAKFKSKGGAEMVCSIIQQAVNKVDTESKKDLTPYLPACLSILRCLTHHDYSLRHSLARDSDLYYALIRVSLLHPKQDSIKMDVSHILTLLLFDEVSKFDVGFGESQVPGTKFSLPAQVIQRYRLPFLPQSHHTYSPSSLTLPDDSSDIMTTRGPKEMMKVAWNVAWHGGLDPLVDSFGTQLFTETNKDFSPALTLTPVEQVVLETSNIQWLLRSRVESIRQATSHQAVTSAINHMMSYTAIFKIPALSNFFTGQDWFSVLDKFLTVTPTSSSDQSLLLHVLKFISSVLPFPKGQSPVLTWLLDKLYCPSGPLISLLSQSVAAEQGTIHRALTKVLLQYVTTINLSLPYQLQQRYKSVRMRGDLVRTLQRGLNVTDAPHFYNLASLEGTLTCLLHITARPGWSAETSDCEALVLCNQLLKNLLEVVWSFHVGRGGASQSYMGRGVTKSGSLCLLHLVFEMSSVAEDENWVKSWLYRKQNDGTENGFNWLLTLWAYRDSEVRAAGLGIAAGLTSTEAGRLLMTANCKHIPGGLWGAAFSVLLDPQECCMVRQQAGYILINLTSQAMPSGQVETTEGTWHGPLVIDPDCQLMLTGTEALRALLEHTSLFACVAQLLDSLYTSSLIQPVLVSTDLEDTDSTFSTTDSRSDAPTGRTAQTTVLSLSASLTPNLTPRSKQTTSTDRSKVSTLDSTLTNTLSTNTEASVNSQTEESQSIATPGLVCSMVKLLSNVLHLTPQYCLEQMRQHSLMTALVSLVTTDKIQSLCNELSSRVTGSSSALTLLDILQMFESIVDLLSALVTMDTNSRIELLGKKTALTSLASLLLLQWPAQDDVGDMFASLANSVLKLLCRLLQHRDPMALHTLTAILGPIWSPLIESLCLMLDDSSSDRQSLQASCLDFLALLLCEESRSLVKTPNKLLDIASVAELLDASLNNEESGEVCKDVRTTGQMLSKVFLHLFDVATKVEIEEKVLQDVSRTLKVISAFKVLLSVSQSAKLYALEGGLVELTIEHIKTTHAQLNLNTLNMLRTGGKREEVLIQELILVFDFLRNFMYNNTSVKVACYHSGLTVVVQKMWSWCQLEGELLTSVLSLLACYTAHCNSAAASIASPTSVLTTGKQAQGTIFHSILKLAQRELDREECSPVLQLTFSLLTTLVINSDCRNLLWKSTFLHQFSQLNPRKKRVKVKVAIDILWCQLLTALSFSVDGQQIILKIPEALTVLIELMEAGSKQCQHSATLTIRNLCCHAGNKPKLLASDKLIPVLMQRIENSCDHRTQLIATSALWALINNHKARVQVKSANIALRLVDLLQNLQNSGNGSGTIKKSCENIKAIISAIRT
ncbi:rotatin-like [Physella acuta]|uniref:rotatin-like n=1 Tax=Physella acuta TaxID=109671 RepID=UPI0027DB1ED2|nr:rotatin-like [Physella acuta]